MQKDLKEMTLKELWALFPIVLTHHNTEWAQWAREEIDRLSYMFRDFDLIINHIGSTAIPGIMAKPIIDILIEVTIDMDWLTIKNIMENSNYICMCESEDRISFNKGYTPTGYAEKVFHIHFHRIGDNDEVIFRDYLIDHPEVANEYEQLKLSLLPKYKNDRDGYTDAKTDFVRKVHKATLKP